MLIRRAAPLLACAFLGLSAAFADGPPGTDLEGCWECTNARPKVMFRFTPKKAFYWLDGMLAIGPAKYGPSEVSFPAMGRKQAYRYTLDGAKLTLQSPMSGTFLCRKLDACPPDLADPKPLVFGKAVDLPKAKIAALMDELTARHQKGETAQKKCMEMQASRSPPMLMEKASREANAIAAENAAWITSRTAEIGWFDGKRFGFLANRYAMHLVQSSQRLPLMLAALPEVEKGVAAKWAEGIEYAQFFDQTRLLMGERQRYGTQISDSGHGPVISLLEDRKRLDELRKSMDLKPIADFLAECQKRFGTPVTIEDD